MSAIQTKAPGADEFLDGGFADAAGAAGDEGVAAVEAEGLASGESCGVVMGIEYPCCRISLLRCFKDSGRGVAGGEGARDDVVDDGGEGGHLRAGGQLARAEGDGFNVAVGGDAGLQLGLRQVERRTPTAPWRVMPRSRSGEATKRRNCQASSLLREPEPMASAQKTESETGEAPYAAGMGAMATLPARGEPARLARAANPNQLAIMATSPARKRSPDWVESS